MTDTKIRVRFAPSPTGFLHMGSARTALFNWLYARSAGGTFVLRIEDTDQNREKEGAIRAIVEGLRWLGLDWDEGPEAGGEHGPYFQSERRALYDKHFRTLEEKGLVYTEENGAVRFKSPRQPVTIPDLICGEVTFDRDEPDMTIRRPDGSYIFHFVNVVDDIEMNITHVIRGEDHLTNTSKHIELFRALGFEPPRYGHIPLLLNEDRSKMSKRSEGAIVAYYQEQGYLPDAVLNYLCLLGWNPKDDREQLSIDDVVSLFSLSDVNSSNAVFDLQKLTWLNGQYILARDPARYVDEALAHLRTKQDIADEPYLRRVVGLLQEKVKTFAEFGPWIDPFLREDYPYDEKAVKKAFKAKSLELLASLRETLQAGAGEWSEETINAAIEQTAAAGEVKPGKLMHPLRIAASGQSFGPHLVPMLVVLGRERVLARLGRTLETFA